MTRKQFLQTVAGALGAGAALAACGDDGGPAGVDAKVFMDAPAGNPNCLMNGTTVTIGTNHGHSLTVSKADVMAGTVKTYDITGTSLHAHSVTITAAQFAMLAANTTIMVMSTAGGGHDHQVTVRCA
jgi:hypothetical protein